MGLCAVWLLVGNQPSKSLSDTPGGETTETESAKTSLQPLQFDPNSQLDTEYDRPNEVPVNRHGNFSDVVTNLERLVAFKGKEGAQTFWISDVRYDNGEYAYAYWKQDNSITILHFPLDAEPSESELYWLTGKARIDLKNVVPTGKYENLGCCLIEKDWADKVLSWCNAGYKLTVAVQRKSRP